MANKKELSENIPKTLESNESENVAGGIVSPFGRCYHDATIVRIKEGDKDAWQLWTTLRCTGGLKPHVDELPYDIPYMSGIYSSKDEAVEKAKLFWKCENLTILK